MKYIFELSRRTTLQDDIDLKHQELLTGLSLVNQPFGKNSKIDYQSPFFGNDMTAIVSLNKILGSGVKGFVSYRYRRLLDDIAEHDDHIHITFNTNKINFQDFVNSVIKQYIDCFKPYKAVVYNEDLIYDDFEKSRHKNTRKEIFRHYPIAYYDETFCKEAIKLSANDLYIKIKEKVDTVELYSNGILITSVIDFVNVEESNICHNKMSRLLL